MSLVRPLSVYVHFPWCLAKCPYCDFLSAVSREKDALGAPIIPHERYADAVLAELERRAPALGERRLQSVFFGGGTPSLWEPKQLGRVLHALLARFPSEDPVEITAECNPSSLDQARAEALLAVGVNRLSIGVQSLNEERLRYLGRLHDPAGALAALAAARRAGAKRLSADLIFGVHGQTAEEAANEAAQLVDLGLTHLSAYALTVEPNTRFGELKRRGRLPLLGEDTVAESFERVEATLERRGLAHYEVSNYAVPGQEARHNLVYWRGGEYLGLGAGAVGTVCVDGGGVAAGSDSGGSHRLRTRNTAAVDRYAASAALWPSVDPWSRSELVAEVEPIDPETALSERLMLGLRLADGLDVEAEARQLGVEPWPAERRRALDRLVARGAVRFAGGRVVIPKERWLVADGIIAELL